MESFQEYKARIVKRNGPAIGYPQDISYDATCVEPGMLHLTLTDATPAWRTTRNPQVEIEAHEPNTPCKIVITVGQVPQLEVPPEAIVFVPCDQLGGA